MNALILILIVVAAIAATNTQGSRRGRRPYPVKRAIRAGKGL